jgi:exonuclease SbcC
MRPLSLRISGLRSYRSEVTIDFGDPGLIAIVGDTGAGKSSILEALFFVLYGGCTWDQRAVVPLISDGATVMQVELVFLAEGRRWRVFRSASSSGAQGRHDLECLDDPATRFDNADPVTDEIKRLIGLDPAAFLRTVILPQGRFQALLQAPPGARTAILKGIFRLDQLAHARERADMAARRIRPGLQNLDVQRAALLPDPRAALAHARQRSDQARARHAVLQDLSQEISVAGTERDRADRQASDLQAREEQARQTMMPAASAALANLAATGSRLEDQRRHIDAEREQHRREASSHAEMLARADDQGEGIQALASAAAMVKSLTDQLPGLIDDEATCQQEAIGLKSLSHTAGAKQAEAASLTEQAAAAQTEQERLAAAERSASERLAEAKTRLATARNRAATGLGWQDAAREAAERESAARQAIEPAAERARARAEERDAARQALETIRRAHAAAHAAEGCRPGEPCPICQRLLPDGFSMPAPPGEADTQVTLSTAEQAAAGAATDLATCQSDLANATRNRERADQEEQQASEALALAVTELRLMLTDADLSISDEILLAPLLEVSRAAAAKREEQAAETRKLAGKAAAATAEASTLSQQHQQRSDELRNRQVAIQRRRASWEEAASALPDRYRAGVPITAEALAAIAGRVEGRRAELAQVKDQLESAQRSVDQAGRELEALNKQIRLQVDEPAQQIIIKLAAAEQRLDDLAALLGRPAAPARPDGGLADNAEWAHGLTEATNAALAQAQTVIVTLRQRHDQARSAISDALATAGVEDEPGLRQAIVEVLAELQRADEDIQVATEQIPLVTDLASRIGQAEGLLAALDELTRLLSDGNFIAYVVARKQQTLLAIAAEVLSAMTGGRYGFSETFEIVDRLTGLPRGVKTLSGGETFLASLALALGLVELAGRGGGRLDALFLDEGFGSLDANSLSEALDALGRQAETGRLVAVISHLRSVAESMDRVLAVSVGPSGSQVRWLGGDERDQLITEDVEASLLS